MKERAYSGIAGIGGDRLATTILKAATRSSSSGFFEEANIHCPWLDEYVSNPSVAKRIADHLRITKGVWKRMFYTLPNGACYRPTCLSTREGSTSVSSSTGMCPSPTARRR